MQLNIRNLITARVAWSLGALALVFLLGALSSIYEPNGGSSWVHQSIYKGKMILGLDKLKGVEGGLAISSDRYEFTTAAKASQPGVWFLATTDSKNIIAIERSSGMLLHMKPKDGGGYSEHVMSASVFPKDAGGKAIFNEDETLVNSKPPIAMGAHYGNKKFLYSLVTQTKIDGKICQKMSLIEVPLPSLDAEPGPIVERYSTPCVADGKNTVMWAGRITSNDKNFFMSVGDMRYDRSQYPKKDLFSAADLVVEKTVFGKILAFNPATFKHEIYSMGHRNPQGLFWDNDHKELWSAEHGPQGGDEVNRIVKGGHYGWPLVTLGKPYKTMYPSNKPVTKDSKNPSTGVDLEPARTGIRSGTHDGFVPPIMAWSTGNGIGGLFRVPMDSPLKDWRGDIITATMAENHLHRLRLHQGATIFDEDIPAARIRDLMLLGNGDLVLSLDKGDLLVMRVSDV